MISRNHLICCFGILLSLLSSVAFGQRPEPPLLDIEQTYYYPPADFIREKGIKKITYRLDTTLIPMDFGSLGTWWEIWSDEDLRVATIEFLPSGKPSRVIHAKLDDAWIIWEYTYDEQNHLIRQCTLHRLADGTIRDTEPCDYWEFDQQGRIQNYIPQNFESNEDDEKNGDLSDWPRYTYLYDAENRLVELQFVIKRNSGVDSPWGFSSGSKDLVYHYYFEYENGRVIRESTTAGSFPEKRIVHEWEYTESGKLWKASMPQETYGLAYEWKYNSADQPVEYLDTWWGSEGSGVRRRTIFTYDEAGFLITIEHQYNRETEILNARFFVEYELY